MTRHFRLALLAAAPLLTACAGMSAGAAGSPAATAQLRDVNGQVVGEARFTQQAGGVRVHVSVQGVGPGAHGLHVHQTGACEATPSSPFNSAGGHFNPSGRQHGHENPQGFHHGDLPNLVVDAGGAGTLDVAADWLTLSSLFDADGSALVLHQGPDDQRTDPSGNSGARIACGVITRS